MQKDVKFNGTNPRSPLESIKVSKKRTQTNSKRTGKAGCKHAKKPKRSEGATSKRQVQEDGNYPLQGGIIALAPRRDGNDRRFVSTAVQISRSRRRWERLRRPDLRKASGFPANPAPFILLRAGWKAEPSSLRGGGCSGKASFGKAKPFRKSGGGAAARRQR
jgi:hypothetical protein